jgi:hypothetical protein
MTALEQLHRLETVDTQSQEELRQRLTIMQRTYITILALIEKNRALLLDSDFDNVRSFSIKYLSSQKPVIKLNLAGEILGSEPDTMILSQNGRSYKIPFNEITPEGLSHVVL